MACPDLPSRRAWWRTFASLALAVAGVAGGALGLCAQAQAAPAAGTAISTRVTATYVVEGSFQAMETVTSTAVVVMVEPVAALQLTASPVAGAAPGAPVTVPHLLTNTGNAPATYTLALAHDAGGSFALAGLFVVHDRNGNGLFDAADVRLALGTPGVVPLAVGESARLLVVGQVPAGATGGTAAVRLTVAVDGAGASASSSAVSQVAAARAAALTVTHALATPEPQAPGAVVALQVLARNVGVADARATDSPPAPGSRVLIDGRPARMVLLRSAVPVGAAYVAGSLAPTHAHAVRLFRLPADPPYSYRTGADDAAAVEVAAAWPAPLAPEASLGYGYTLRLTGRAGTSVQSSATAVYDDGAAAREQVSNVVAVDTVPSRLGVAMTAVPRLPSLQPVDTAATAAAGAATGAAPGASAAAVPGASTGNGTAPDDTLTFDLTLRLANLGTRALYGVALTTLLEGADKLGTYTTAAAPGPGQFTVVAGSLRVVDAHPGAQVQARADYQGTAARGGLLAPDASLMPGATATVALAVRVHPGSRTDTVALAATAAAAYAAGQAPTVVDESTDGDSPDPDGNGDATDNAVPTAVRLGVFRIGLVRSATLPVPVPGAADTFAFELHYTVRNQGTVPLTFVRVADNLACSLGAAVAAGQIASWQLAGPPQARHGLLRSAGAAFTGQAPCRAGVAWPDEMALVLTDGSRSLAPGQQEEIALTVRVVRPGGLPGTPLRWPGTAYAAAFDANLVGATQPRAWAASSASVALALPMGVVYRSDERTPLAGVAVALRRGSCSAAGAGSASSAVTPGTPITADQLEGSDTAGLYTFQADGSVSMTTAADGAYRFLLRAPPVADTCDYTLALSPPAGFTAPSAMLPALPGAPPGGAVQTQAQPPAGAEPTAHHLTVRLGPGLPAVWNNHLPVDPVTAGALLLRKAADKPAVEMAEFVTYVLVLANRSRTTLGSLRIDDTLPAGFALVPGSVRLVDAQGQARPLAHPAGATGPRLAFDLATETLPADGQLSLRYRVRVGVGAMQGDGVNRAVAYSGQLASNEAAARVTVRPGVFGTEAVLLGKVYLDCNASGTQDPGEPGVPGVRLLLQSGTSVVTDSQGQWSLYGLKPTTHVLKVDPITLPAGAQVRLTSTRQAGRAGSLFVDLKNGELHQADIALGPCDAEDAATSVQAQVAQRRKALGERPDAEGEAAVARPFDAQGRPTVPQDVRGLPASGTTEAAASGRGAATTVATSGPAPAPGSAQPGAGRSAMLPPALGADAGAPATLPPPARAPLESLMDQLDPAPGFLSLADGDVLPTAQADVRVKGRAGTTLRLTVNGEVVSERRVGKKAELPSRDVAAWEYIAVAFVPGDNHLLLEQMDGFGQVRGQVALRVVAPGRAAKLAVDVPASATVGKVVPVRVRLVDANGVPVTERTAVTLESTRGRWADDDLDPAEPGTQRFIEGGRATFNLLPPAEPGPATLRVGTGTLVRDAQIHFLPELRPLVGAGIVEGVIDLRGRGRTTLQPARSRDNFEAELTLWSKTSDDGRLAAAARTAFYFKGAVRGDYLLTAAYDSEKSERDRLFRDIRPDEFYPVYGDASVRSFDAQSTGRLYVRVDHGKSYLLFGDFNTAAPASGGGADARRLSQFSRSVTGVQHRLDTDAVQTTVFASRDSLRQQVDEFPANGTSGPFMLRSGGDFYAQSEKVDVVVRDRRQPGTVLTVTPLARFTDYEIEPATGRLLLKGPLASVDENLNPRSLRVTYEVDTGGPAFWVGGAEVQATVAPGLQVGALVARDTDPGKAATLAGVTAQWKPLPGAVVQAELAQTHTDAKGDGRAGRLEAKVDQGRLGLKAQVQRVGESFDNPGAFAQKGRDEASVGLAWKADERVSIVADAADTRDHASGSQSQTVLLGVQAGLAEGVQLDAGVRLARVEAGAQAGAGSGGGAASAGSAGTTPGAADDTWHTVRAKLTVQPAALPQAKAYVEAEQDVSQHERRLLAFGGSYQLGERTRLFGRYEAISTLGNPTLPGQIAPDHVAAFGIDSTYLPGHSAFGEYRVRDTVAGRENLLATGLRSRWQVAPGLNLGAGVERTAPVGNASGGDSPGGGNGGPTSAPRGGSSAESIAVTTSADYAQPGLRLDSRLEWRRSGSSRTVLNTLGAAWRIDTDWSLLARSAVEHTDAFDGADALRLRHQLGLAWRPAEHDRWTALVRYEHRQERRDAPDAAAGATGTAGGSGGAGASVASVGIASVDGLERTHVLSAHVAHKPWRGLQLSGRLAVKHHTLDAEGLRSSAWAQLISGRAMWELAPRWDAGVLAMLHSGSGGVRQTGLGLEAGYRVADDLWLSLGFNAFHLRDDALTGDAAMQRGLYVRLRFKFDEGLFR